MNGVDGQIGTEGLHEFVFVIVEAQLLLTVAAQRKTVTLVTVTLVDAQALFPHSIQGVEVERYLGGICTRIRQQVVGSLLRTAYYHRGPCTQFVVDLFTDVQQYDRSILHQVFIDEIDLQLLRQLGGKTQIQGGCLSVVKGQRVVAVYALVVVVQTPAGIIFVVLQQTLVETAIIDEDAHGRLCGIFIL